LLSPKGDRPVASSFKDKDMTTRTITGLYDSYDPTTREKSYRDGGWSEFDEKSVPYTPADVARERALHSVHSRELLDHREVGQQLGRSTVGGAAQ
jgi:hypothetical protein